MFKDLEIMKTLRYLLSLVAILSVMGVSAATYGTSHQPRYRRVIIHQVEARSDMPEAMMSPMNSAVMQSGTTLPFAAATGVTTANDNNPSKAPGRPRRVGENEEFEEEEDPDTPANPFPIGDAVLPLMLMAVAFGQFVYRRRRKGLVD